MTVQEIRTQLAIVYNGNPWYGDSVVDKLDLIHADLAFARLSHHSIYQIVLHMLAWRTFIYEKVVGNEAYTLVDDSEDDWPSDPDETDATWKQTLNNLALNQEHLLAALTDKKDTWLSFRAPGSSFTYGVLLEGLIQHDVYHLGQIGLLVKMAGN
jgi:uncharacterized damage-inducible protein DinB